MPVAWVDFMPTHSLRLVGKSKNECNSHSFDIELLKVFSKHLSVNVCDLPEKYESLKNDFEGNLAFFYYEQCQFILKKLYSITTGTNITVLRDGFQISRTCDWIMYAVEAEFIDSVVAKYGPGKVVIWDEELVCVMMCHN